MSKIALNFILLNYNSKLYFLRFSPQKNYAKMAIFEPKAKNKRHSRSSGNFSCD
jgi:hypothetical protein